MFSIKRDQADKVFSLFIRYRDHWRCVRCGRQHEIGASTLGNSHFWGRANESTRFDPENCDAICNMPCHRLWGGDERPAYVEWKKKQLGEKRYKALDVLSHSYKKKDRAMSLLQAKLLLKEACPEHAFTAK